MVKIVGKKGQKGRKAAPSVKGKKGDARNKLIKLHRNSMTDARDQLVRLARKTDARQKLDKIRNLKQGKLDVKKRGAITITTTTAGKLELSTKKKQQQQKPKPQSNITKRVGKGGVVKVTTNKNKNKVQSTVNKVTTINAAGKKKVISVAAAARPQRQRPVKLTRTIKGEMSESAKLDAELMSTHVDPVVIKRTVRQDTR